MTRRKILEQPKQQESLLAPPFPFPTNGQIVRKLMMLRPRAGAEVKEGRKEGREGKVKNSLARKNCFVGKRSAEDGKMGRNGLGGEGKERGVKYGERTPSSKVAGS